MPRLFLKYPFIIATAFVILQTYLTISHYKNIEQDKIDLLKEKKIQNILIKLKYNKKYYKAFAAVIDDSRSWAYGYASNHRTQKSANLKALKLCEEKRKKQKISKKCRLFNSFIDLGN